MTEQEIRESEQLQECERCEGWGATRAAVCSCPSNGCNKTQHANGLIAWCDAGHIYQLTKDDPRYSLA